MSYEGFEDAFRSGTPDDTWRPRRGSAAKGQKRERDGRFRGARSKRNRKRPKRGVVGPSWIDDKTKLEKVRHAVRLFRIRDRFRDEAKGLAQPLFEPDTAARMGGIQELQHQSTAAKLSALHSVRKRYYKSRNPLPLPEHIVAEVAKELGGPISSRTLYRPPYVTTWGGRFDYFGRAPEDLDPRAKALYRESNPIIVQTILDLREEISALQAARASALVEQSEVDGWEAW